jgi:hypothetical protein
MERLEDLCHSSRVKRPDELHPQPFSVYGEGKIQDEEIATDQIDSLMISTYAADQSLVADPVAERSDVPHVVLKEKRRPLSLTLIIRHKV